MPRENMKPAKSSNPRWLDAARLFYAESFGATQHRTLRAAQEDWAELTEDEQSFALAHLHYLGLMAQAGTQRLLVQVRDLLDEIADVAELAREVPEDETGSDGGGLEDEPEDGEPAPFEPPAVADTLPPAADGEPVDADGDDASDDEGDDEDQDQDDSDDDQDEPEDEEPEDDDGRAA